MSIAVVQNSKRVNHIRKSRADRIFDAVIYTAAGLMTLVALYPMYFILIASISDPNLVAKGDVLLIPRGISLEGYSYLLSMGNLWIGYGNTILYTLAGTAIMLAVNIPVAYALSRKDLVGRNFFMMLITFTMIFSGGLIPTYLLVRDLNMLDTIWALIIPVAVRS